MAKEITITLYRNILSDLPARLTSYARTLDLQPKLQADIRACVTVIEGWLKGNADPVRCTRSRDSWDWLCEVCKSMKAWAAATVIELKVEAWFRERDEAERAADAKVAREALEAEEESNG